MSTPTPVPGSTYANQVMQQAVKDIDELFGLGYSKEHPELVVGYLQTEITLRGQNAGIP